ncbi:hypothetical protein [Xanthomonas sp. 3058]|uniref:hypothetical protein n=1 Tax=Xanthomonas sp. 3058 TaxID=3035314 RepID=UPI001608F173|nr:hypothetical protein [Xanthomonas sp. 3058]MBB5862843.1 hypothetical protein [Xanthomonas sp. 3058]
MQTSLIAFHLFFLHLKVANRVDCNAFPNADTKFFYRKYNSPNRAGTFMQGWCWLHEVAVQ